MKETIWRAKRLTREMQSYWKRYDRVERETRRRLEKEAEEQRKMDVELIEVSREILAYKRRLYFCCCCCCCCYIVSKQSDLCTFSADGVCQLPYRSSCLAPPHLFSLLVRVPSRFISSSSLAPCLALCPSPSSLSSLLCLARGLHVNTHGDNLL